MDAKSLNESKTVERRVAYEHLGMQAADAVVGHDTLSVARSQPSATERVAPSSDQLPNQLAGPAVSCV